MIAGSEKTAAQRAKRKRVLSQLIQLRGVSKDGLARVLETLSSADVSSDALIDGPNLRNYRRAISTVTNDHAFGSSTPYGPLVQHIELASEQLPQWPYVNPFAFLAYFSTISYSFFAMIRDVVQKDLTKPLRLVLYIDEYRPGNPLRPDLGRASQAIYWIFIDYPKWLLCRKDMWPCFGVLRSRLLSSIPGGISGLMRMVLRIFFSPDGHSFKRGCVVSHGSESIMVTAVFCGFMADEKGLKEVFDIKGQSGVKCCFNCGNLARHTDLATSGPNLVDLTCSDLSKFKKITPGMLKVMLKRLTESPTVAVREKLSKDFGINYNPDGLLYDKFLLRNVMDPLSNYIRDWMHTVASQGVAGTELSFLIQALVDEGVSLEIVRTYARKFVLPRSRGKVTDLFFKPELILTDKVKHFASDVLNMIPIMHMFLVDTLKPLGLLPRHIECQDSVHDDLHVEEG